jgi:outer membrane protein TolC
VLPHVAGSGGWLNRTFNRRSLGLDAFGPPGTPDHIGPFDNWDVRLRFTQALFDPASLGRVRAARAGTATAEAERTVAAEAAARTAAVAYLRVARADGVLAARRADLRLAVELHDLAQTQLEIGVGTALDVTRARAQVVEVREGIVVAESNAGRARIALTRAMGLPPETALGTADPLDETTAAGGLPRDRSEALARAERDRPERGAEEAREHAAQLAVAAIAAERWPRLELAADYGLNGRTVPDAIATRQVALQVTLPLLDGFRREGRLDEQRARARAAALRRSELDREVAAEVDIALLDLRAAEAQQAIAVERLDLAQQELDQARDRFTIGTAGNVELIDAQLALLRARDAQIEARFAAAAARVALARAIGGSRMVR